MLPAALRGSRSRGVSCGIETRAGKRNPVARNPWADSRPPQPWRPRPKPVARARGPIPGRPPRPEPAAPRGPSQPPELRGPKPEPVARFPAARGPPPDPRRPRPAARTWLPAARGPRPEPAARGPPPLDSAVSSRAPPTKKGHPRGALHSSLRSRSQPRALARAPRLVLAAAPTTAVGWLVPSVARSRISSQRSPKS